VARQLRRFGSTSGQAMIMLTLGLVPMFAIMGLVTDFGYMHFIKMSAQTAAEAAAQAAMIDFHSTVGGASLTCETTGVVCSSTPTTCAANITTPTNSLEHGCMYAQAPDSRLTRMDSWRRIRKRATSRLLGHGHRYNTTCESRSRRISLKVRGYGQN